MKKRAIQIDAVIFDLIIMGFFLLLALLSFGYNPRARSIPLGLGIVGSVMSLLQFLVDALPRVRSKLRFVSSSGVLATEEKFLRKDAGSQRAKLPDEPEKRAPAPEEREKVKPIEWWRVFRIVLWLVGFIVLLALTNYLIAVGAFVVLATKLEARESWKRAILLGVFVDGGFFILFELLLQAQI
jgi:hypothetical protein